MKTCCFGCANLTFIGPFDPIDKYFQSANLMMPIESAKGSEKYIGLDYIYFLEVPGVTFLAKESPGATVKLTKNLFTCVIQTWPLFLIAFLMAAIAGCVMWILVSIYLSYIILCVTW